MKPPYCEIHGLVCTDQISSVKVDGADRKLDTQAIAGRRTGEILDAGRNPREITLMARFLTEEDLDEFIGHVNSAPEDCEAYPFRNDRCVYVKMAQAFVYDSEVACFRGQTSFLHRAKAILHTRESWMYGEEKGARYESTRAMPVAANLEHEGTVEDLPVLDKLTARGQFKYISGNKWTENLKLIFTPTGGNARELLLCTKMMRNDLFEIDRFGNVQHSYENDFNCDISSLQTDLYSATYLAYCTITNEKLTISGAGRCIFSFYGPLPISAEPPYLDLDIASLGTRTPKIVAGTLSDLSDLEEIEAELHVGENRIHIPGYEGQDDFFVGFIERRCWISAPSMATARGYTAGGGTSSDTLCMGGSTGSNSAITEEYNGTTWSSGGNLATARRMLAGDGGCADGICMGGQAGAVSAATEEYNGTAWSSGGNLAMARNCLAGGGSSTNAIAMGGYTGSAVSAATEEYNGTAWSSGGNLGDAREGLGGGGNAISAMCCGGYNTYLTYSTHEVYDGSAWAQAGNLLVARSFLAADGDLWDGLAVGGNTYHPVSTTEEFEGTTWISGGSLITARYGLAGGGVVNAICMGGLTPTGVGLTANYHANAETYGRNGSVTLNNIRAVVKRYINPVKIPTVDPGDTFELKVDSKGSGELAYLEMFFRDAWWF